ncbi:MAG TPA: Asp-tRNA(Asn)/Glu-tRNA(Gln) amidotransferase subunit GatC [Candidatus Paceibacterota bacterium]|nr:Asp-tRNA(Asn)/Glu-tRNA(Gln) amidotransferase subunit GatC [Candidatus Paceibacterota bacterium]
MLTKEQVNHIAVLARIELDDAMRERMRKDLSSILDYIDQLSRVDTAGVDPLYQVTGLENQARPDEYRGDWPMDAKLSDLLVGQAPHRHDRFVKVKSVKAK